MEESCRVQKVVRNFLHLLGLSSNVVRLAVGSRRYSSVNTILDVQRPVHNSVIDFSVKIDQETPKLNFEISMKISYSNALF